MLVYKIPGYYQQFNGISPTKQAEDAVGDVKSKAYPKTIPSTSPDRASP
jgi:hypothetical protein